jgi:hypothetical protein
VFSGGDFFVAPLSKFIWKKRSSKKENGKLHNEQFLMWLGRSRLYVLWLSLPYSLFHFDGAICSFGQFSPRLSTGYRPDWRLISSVTIDADNQLHYWCVDPHKLGIMNFAAWTPILSFFCPCFFFISDEENYYRFFSAATPPRSRSLPRWLKIMRHFQALEGKKVSIHCAESQ